MCANNSVHKALKAPGELFFSLSELQRLVEMENSCVSVATTKRSISLMPLHLKNLKASVKELLQAKVNRYDVQLEGVILAHKNVKLMVNSTLLSDSRYFHLEYFADIYVFKPEVGNMLTGVVNKWTKEYVNILVHGIFNVTVFPTGSQEISGLKIGNQVVVKVTALDYTGQLPFIKASIISLSNDEAESTSGLKKNKRKRNHREENTSLIGISQREEQSSLIGISQRKELVSILKNSPLRIASRSSTELESQDAEAESSSTESSKARNKGQTPAKGEETVETSKRKKKKKKSKSEDVSLEVPSKKRKREEEATADKDQIGDIVSPKKKKKKKDKNKDEEIQPAPQSVALPPSMNLEKAPKSPLDSTALIQADESIFKAASSTPLGPPPSPKKRKRSDKADQSALVDSLMHMKMEEMSAMDTSADDAVRKTKTVKQEARESRRDSLDAADSPASSSHRKKKKKKKSKDENSSTDDLSRAMLSQALKSMKNEV